MIRVNNLCKTFSDGEAQKVVLDGLCFSVAAGESFAITGESGCGKSSLLNILASLEDADSGEIWVNDINIAGMSESQSNLYRQSQIGIIFQRFNLIDCLSIRDNISLPARLNNIHHGSYIDKLIDHLGLQPHLDKLPAHLSGGEQQRVAIARALSHQPSIVFADEPTGNLDDKNSKIVADILLDITQSFQTTLVLVTHSKRFASRADTHVFLRNGQLVSAKC